MKSQLLKTLVMLAALILPWLADGGRSVAAQPVDVLPVSAGPATSSLDGEWSFKYISSSELGADEKFFQPSFDVAAWKTIPVPSHWELHGFAEPKYKKVDEGTGLYRRTFRVPRNFSGQRVMLRFDGVLYGLTVWVNGKEIGQWSSSYNPVTFDITDALLPGDADNVIAVRVTTRSKGWEFDTNDCWALSGIYREVTLFAVPPIHLKDYTARTTLKPDGSAELQLEIVASAAAEVAGKLISPDGKVAKEFQLTLPADGHNQTNLSIGAPQLWTAETPALYRLELAIQSGGKTAQQFTDKIGLRQITIENGVLKLNGTPIKLRGINHHDIWPDEGRVATEALMRHDLELMRDANINFIRTSHYPPHPRFIKLCDEMGFYVMDEVPFGFGDKNLTDPSFEDVLYTRARATVMRDKNRPSVIVWSIGNENPLTELGIKTAGYTKKIDPTRPVCFPTVGSYFRAHLDQFKALPEFVEIFAPHYAGVERIREYAESLQRPIIGTEYAHALGLAFDSFQDIWELHYHSPRVAGGAVWMFQDQGIRRDVRMTGQPLDGAKYVWPDASHYFDTAATDGCDGIVYSDRTPQVDYWQVRKVFAPVRIVERHLNARPGEQEIKLAVENRHDFRTLAGMALNWSLCTNGVIAQSGSLPLGAPPHGHETVSLKLNLPADAAQQVSALQLVCVNELGRTIVERSIRLDVDEEPLAEKLVASLPVADALKVEQTETTARVIHPDFSVNVNRRTGEVQIRSTAGELLATGFFPHTGRRFTMAEELRVARAKKEATESDLRTGISSIWSDAYLRAGEVQLAEAKSTANGASVTIRGKYPRPDAPTQSLNGEVMLQISRRGSISVSYNFKPEKTDGQLLEVGLSMLAPSAASEFRWLGAGPFAGYPGKDALNEFGLFHLTSEDIRFQGNRRDVELALLTTKAGSGVLLAGTDLDVAVENVSGGVIFSHNERVSGRGNKGGTPDNSIKGSSLKQVAGEFTLLPLANKWPAALNRWFSSTAGAADLQKPFLRSYDQ